MKDQLLHFATETQNKINNISTGYMYICMKEQLLQFGTEMQDKINSMSSM